VAQPKIILLLLLTLSLTSQTLRSQTNDIKYLSAYQSAMGSNTIMVSGSNFGIDEYQERRFALSYSRLLSDKLVIGSTASYFRNSIDEYGSQNDFQIDFGFIARISSDVILGLYVSNVLPSEELGYLRDITELTVGGRYNLSDQVTWLIEVESDLSDYFNFSSGISYQIIERLDFMIGMNTRDKGLSIGLTYNVNNSTRITGANRATQNLGNSPGLSIRHQRAR